MDAGDEEPGGIEILQAAVADERHVEVACARPIGVKWRFIFPALPRDGAAPQDTRRARRHKISQQATELFELVLPSAKGQPNHVPAFFLLRQPALEVEVVCRVSHMAESFKYRATLALRQADDDHFVTALDGDTFPRLGLL